MYMESLQEKTREESKKPIFLPIKRLFLIIIKYKKLKFNPNIY